jgi:UDP-N-acetylmuramate--alanine ligase
VIAVMQPHRYTRLQSLFDQFATCFNDADVVIIADVYPAGEQKIEGVDRDALVAAIKAHGHRRAIALPSPEELPKIVREIAKPGDYVVCLGAGNITQWAYALPEQLAGAGA